MTMICDITVYGNYLRNLHLAVKVSLLKIDNMRWYSKYYWLHLVLSPDPNDITIIIVNSIIYVCGSGK